MCEVQRPALQLVSDSIDCNAFEFTSSRRKNFRGQIVQIAIICSSGVQVFSFSHFKFLIVVFELKIVLFWWIFSSANSFQSLSYQKAGRPSCKSRTAQKLPHTNHWRSDSCEILWLARTISVKKSSISCVFSSYREIRSDD